MVTRPGANERRHFCSKGGQIHCHNAVPTSRGGNLAEWRKGRRSVGRTDYPYVT